MSPRRAFWRACRDGDHVTAERLLAMGVDPAAVPAGRGPSWPALFHAAGNGHLACVQELLRFGADPNALTSARQTALMSAASMARRDCIGELLKVGDPNLRDAHGSTALAHLVGALFFESFSALDAIACCELLAPLTDPDLADAEGFTPLMLAAGQGHEGLVLAFAPFSRLESQNAQGNHARKSPAWPAMAAWARFWNASPSSGPVARPPLGALCPGSEINSSELGARPPCFYFEAWRF